MNDLIIVAEQLLTDSTFIQVMLGVAAFAAAVKGVSYLLESGWDGFNKWRQILSALTAIGSKGAWPNGSTSLPDAMTEIYRRQNATAELIARHLDRHNGETWRIEAGLEERSDDDDDT